ncbi:MAG: FAD-binding oxidoreductase [Anaerolineae bacterium]
MVKSSIISRLQDIVGQEAVHTAPEDLLLYSYDATLLSHEPEAVVFPRHAEQIAQIMELANAEGVPVVPRGAGTGLSGGAIPWQGGIVLALGRMNQVRHIDTENLVAVVEPGVVNADFQATLAPYGLFYPPDPASMKVCTLGGNVASNSGGPRCLKYGVTRDYVLGLEVVLPTGEIIHTGGQTVKNTTGYDLTRLFVGSEGTLGIVTEITLRLLPQPEAKRTMLAIFHQLDDASRAVSAIISRGIVPTTLEMLDNLLIQCAEDFVHVGLPREAAAVLLIEVDGFQEALDRQVETIQAICQEEGAREVRIAATAQEVDDLWLARRTIIGAVARRRPSMVLQDVTVPRSQLPAMVSRIVVISQELELPIGVLAHAGDGNLHPLILFDQRDEGELARVKEAERAIFTAAVEFGGTLTGEHGIGLTKRAYLSLEFSPKEIEVTQGLKDLFDPHHVLNPGKIIGG